MMKFVPLIFAVFFVVIMPPTSTADISTELVKDPYFVSLIQIGIKKRQTKDFKNLINDYVLDRQKAINRERRKSAERDFFLTVKKIRIRAGKKFARKMKKLLNKGQYERFHSFHMELDKILISRENVNESYDTKSVYPRQTGH